jgi:hypothetical protein
VYASNPHFAAGLARFADELPHTGISAQRPASRDRLYTGWDGRNWFAVDSFCGFAERLATAAGTRRTIRSREELLKE